MGADQALAGLDEKLYVVSESQRLSWRDLLGAFRRHGTARMTDLHIKAGLPPIYRVDGQLRKTGGPPMDAALVEAMTRALLSPSEWETLVRQRSVNSSYLVEDLRFRINAFHDADGLALAIRALDTAIPRIETIGFANNVWQDLIRLKHGLVLVTGTTGSGKSTTIAAVLDRIAETRPCRIITLEDPIEYRFESKQAVISQRAIGRDVPTWERGLRDCLREDPDIIFVGEMTDQESATWTLTAAETGHLVFSGIHTRDARGTLTRLLDMYPQNRHEEVANQLSLGLRYIISQKLLPRADQRGRILAMEILNNTYGVANLLRQNKTEQLYSIMQTQTADVPEQRMITLEKHLARLVRAGKVEPLEAERSANHPAVFHDELQMLA